MAKQFLKLAGVSVLALVFAVPAQADIIGFDPDGPGNPNPTLQVASFDEAPGNVLNIGSNAAIANFLLNLGDGGSRDTTFNAVFQARLAGLNGPGGPIVVPGLNEMPFGTGAVTPGFTPFEITIVARFREVVTSVTILGGGTQQIATFSTIPGPGTFIEFWFDDGSVAGATPSNDLLGTGFQDGRLILTGDINSGSSSFFASDIVAPHPALDSFLADNYPFIDSIVGSGGSNDIKGPVSSVDPGFFTVLPSLIGTTLTDTLQRVPFNSVNPSDRFILSAFGGVAGSTNGVDLSVDTGASPGGVGTLGSVNGLGGFAFPDFQTESDAQTELTIVPEPSTLVLCVLGAGTLGFGRLRRMRRKQAARA